MEVQHSKKRKVFSEHHAEYPKHGDKTKESISQIMGKDKRCSKRSAPQDTEVVRNNKTKIGNQFKVTKDEITQQPNDLSSDIELVGAVFQAGCVEAISKDLYKGNSQGFSPSSPGSDSTCTIPLEDTQKEYFETLIDLGMSDDETTCDFEKQTSAENEAEVNGCSKKNATVDEHLSSSQAGCPESAMHLNQEQSSLKNTSDPSGIPTSCERSSDTPGDFTFIDLGGAPLSVSSNDSVDTSLPVLTSLSQAVQGQEVVEIPNGESKCTTSSSVTDIGVVFPDKGDSRKTTIPNDFEAKTNKFVQPDVAGKNDLLLKCLSNSLSEQPEQSPNEDGFSSSLSSVVARDYKDYIPLDVTSEFLDKREQEIRHAARKIKDTLVPIVKERNRLSEKRQFIKSKIAEQQADLAVRTKVMDSMKQALMSNKEQMTCYEEDKNQQSVSATALFIKKIKTELALRELQQKICQDKLRAVTNDCAGSEGLSVAEDEAKAGALITDITRCSQEEEIAKNSLKLVENCLANCIEEEKRLQLRLNDMDAEKKTAEAVMSENQKMVDAARDKIKLLDAQRKLYTSRFIHLERMMLKTQMCQKLKKLDEKEEGLLGKELVEKIRKRSVCSSAPNNVQFASQLTVIGNNYQSNMLQMSNQLSNPTIVNDRSSVQHYTSLQSITIHNHNPWPLMPSHFPPNILQLGSVAPPLMEVPPLIEAPPLIEEQPTQKP